MLTSLFDGNDFSASGFFIQVNRVKKLKKFAWHLIIISGRSHREEKLKKALTMYE
jgi:hypothetical protein